MAYLQHKMEKSPPTPLNHHQQAAFDGVCTALSMGKSDIDVLEIAQNIVAMLLPGESHQNLREKTLGDLSKWFVDMDKVANISDEYRTRKMRMVSTEVLRLMISQRPEMVDHAR